MFLFRSSSFNIYKNSGFTLVELTVGIAILSILASITILNFNPLSQFNKANDSRRQTDINQIGEALSLYYQDTNCFPDKASFDQILASGGEWSENNGNTVYIGEIPQDPDGTAYSYRASQTVCPQWAVVFADLVRSPGNSDICILASIPSCTPQGFDNTWACEVLGTPNCTEISGS